jgi:hypothetical protein
LVTRIAPGESELLGGQAPAQKKTAETWYI